MPRHVNSISCSLIVCRVEKRNFHIFFYDFLILLVRTPIFHLDSLSRILFTFTFDSLLKFFALHIIIYHSGSRTEVMSVRHIRMNVYRNLDEKIFVILLRENLTVTFYIDAFWMGKFPSWSWVQQNYYNNKHTVMMIVHFWFFLHPSPPRTPNSQSKKLLDRRQWLRKFVPMKNSHLSFNSQLWQHFMVLFTVDLSLRVPSSHPIPSRGVVLINICFIRLMKVRRWMKEWQ